MEGEIRSFPDKTWVKEHTSIKPAQQDMLKGLLQKDKKRERERERKIGKKRIMATNKYLSIIIFNVNWLNVPIKRHRVAEWIRKQTAHRETHLEKKKTRLKVKGGKILPANGQEKRNLV